MRRIVLCLVLAIAATRAVAQEIPRHPVLTDRFYVGIGAFFPQTTTQAQLQNNHTGLGTTIDVEQSLDIRPAPTARTCSRRYR
jgi:hypothetical protein